jgi:hypothetical protein
MIRYSSYGGEIARRRPKSIGDGNTFQATAADAGLTGADIHGARSAPTKLVCSLEIEYRELQNLRERVRMAEAAARDAPARSKKAALSLIEQRARAW